MRVGPLVSIAVTVVLLILISEFGLPSPQAFASLQVVSPAPHAPTIRAGSSMSYNWAGYAVAAPVSSVTDVKGSWIVPSIVGNCPSSTNQYSSFWTGIDGYNSNTVEQVGTDSDCQGGIPTYYAWYEFYPQPSFMITSINLGPGDNIAAEVSYTGGPFVASISDVTTGQSFTTTVKVSSAARSSAEWITEAPSSGGTVLQLANFGISKYGQDRTLISNTNFATVGGAFGQIGSFGSSGQEITMVTKSLATRAQPSSLSTDGTSFDVSQVGGTSTSSATMTVSSTSSTAVVATTSATTTTTSSSSSTTTTTTSRNTRTSSSSSTTTAATTSSATTTATSSSSTNTASATSSTTAAANSTSSTTTATTTTSSTTSVAAALSVAVSTDSSSYSVKSFAYITVNVTANGSPVSGASVTLAVTAPNGAVLQTSGTTGANGQVIIKYRIAPNAPLGTYTVAALASLSGYATGSGSTTFQVA